MKILVKIKILRVFLFVFVGSVLFIGCGKVKNSNLAQDYYKMSMLELEEATSDTACRHSLQYINQALEHESSPQYLAHKATLLFLLSQKDESLSCFNKLFKLRMSPTIRSEIENNYACLLAKCGKTEQAKQIFERLEKNKNYLTPQVALVNLAKIYLECGEQALAKQKLERAVELAPDYVDAHYYLSLVCFSSGQNDLALQSIERTIDLEPAHGGALELRSRIG